MLHPDFATEEISVIMRSVAPEDLVDSLAAGEALRLLTRIEDEDIPLAEVPRLVVRGARLATLSLSPPPKPS